MRGESSWIRSTSAGCSATVRAAAATAPAHDAARFVNSRWQHFFLYGWVPGERVVPANRLCGGDGLVHAINTRQTFVQGLIAGFASAYVNIYSPYTGEVVCEERSAAR